MASAEVGFGFLSVKMSRWEQKTKSTSPVPSDAASLAGSMLHLIKAPDQLDRRAHVAEKLWWSAIWSMQAALPETACGLLN